MPPPPPSSSKHRPFGAEPLLKLRAHAEQAPLLSSQYVVDLVILFPNLVFTIPNTVLPKSISGTGPTAGNNLPFKSAVQYALAKEGIVKYLAEPHELPPIIPMHELINIQHLVHSQHNLHIDIVPLTNSSDPTLTSFSNLITSYAYGANAPTYDEQVLTADINQAKAHINEHIDEQVYMREVSTAVDERTGRLIGRSNSSKFYSTTDHSSPLILDNFHTDPSSIVMTHPHSDISKPRSYPSILRMDGKTVPYFYGKLVHGSFFYAHEEQLGSPAANYCISGSQRWNFIPREYRTRAIKVAAAYAASELQLDIQDCKVQHAMELLVLSKKMWPPEYIFLINGIPVIMVHQRTHEMLLAPGTFIHWGTIGEGTGVSATALAVNYDSWMSFLRDGLDRIIEHFKFLHCLLGDDNEVIERIQSMQELQESKPVVRNVFTGVDELINFAPQLHTCRFLRYIHDCYTMEMKEPGSIRTMAETYRVLHYRDFHEDFLKVCNLLREVHSFYAFYFKFAPHHLCSCHTNREAFNKKYHLQDILTFTDVTHFEAFTEEYPFDI